MTSVSRRITRPARPACLLAVWLAVGGGACSHRESPPEPVAARVPYLAGQPVFDGVLEPEFWSGALVLGPLRRSHDGGAARQDTRVLLGWNNQAFFMSWECRDRDIRGSYTRRDDPLYQQEVVEAFLDTDADGRDYLELEVSPNGQTFDAWFGGRRRERRLDWNPALQLAVKVDGTLNHPADRDRGWTVELALPLAGLPGRVRRPAAGVEWLANFYRIDKSGRGGEASSWQPARSGDFHDPAARGLLRFVGQGAE